MAPIVARRYANITSGDAFFSATSTKGVVCWETAAPTLETGLTPCSVTEESGLGICSVPAGG